VKELPYFLNSTIFTNHLVHTSLYMIQCPGIDISEVDR